MWLGITTLCTFVDDATAKNEKNFDVFSVDRVH
jgi:hypothetical protein